MNWVIAAALGVLGCAAGHDAPRPATLLFVGDMMLGRRVEAAMLEQGDWSRPFRPLGARLRAADLTFGNLECVTAASGRNRTTIEYVRHLGCRQRVPAA